MFSKKGREKLNIVMADDDGNVNRNIVYVTVSFFALKMTGKLKLFIQCLYSVHYFFRGKLTQRMMKNKVKLVIYITDVVHQQLIASSTVYL